jgi:signal transduction histidine kinase/CheY-like chemotaxis protein
MSGTNIEIQLRLANTELNRRIVLLEETLLEKVRTGEALQDSEKRYRQLFEAAKCGTLCSDEMTTSAVRDASGRIVNYVADKRDITEHHRLSAQFQQARKMEAAGLLAGGVAHKQTIIPKVLDLNQNVESMLKMLRRLLGEDINLAWLPEVGLCPIKMDPVQVDQILAKLCVNARDAIADVGTVTIETGNAAFDKTYCAQHTGFIAGKYVLLAVSDDGCGMDRENLDQIFEPFFTNKGAGRGTGLGLSTVYGIVKQNNGFINVYSEPGQGTTIRIYLPRFVDQAADTQRVRTAKNPLSRGETVLVVENEAALLRIAKVMLEELGYRVLAAGTPSEAIRLAEEHANEIQLLITDVVMPEMNGRDLAEWLHSFYPGMKILFMSGYTANVIVHRGVLDEGVNFIQKPFSMQDLAVKVRKAVK